MEMVCSMVSQREQHDSAQTKPDSLSVRRLGEGQDRAEVWEMDSCSVLTELYWSGKRCHSS